MAGGCGTEHLCALSSHPECFPRRELCVTSRTYPFVCNFIYVIKLYLLHICLRNTIKAKVCADVRMLVCPFLFNFLNLRSKKCLHKDGTIQLPCFEFKINVYTWFCFQAKTKTLWQHSLSFQLTDDLKPESSSSILL